MMQSSFSIGDRTIGDGNQVYVIAEMSANHGQDFDRAVQIIEAAKDAGADAIKLQTYTPDTMTIKCDKKYFHIGKGSLWEGRNLYDLYSEAYTPWEWQPKLKKIANDLGMDLFSTAFDPSAVDFLEEMDVPVHKIASFEIVDIPLIEYMAKTGKPIIISTGMASLGELEQAVAAARGAGCQDLVLLKCTSTYPATPANTNIRTIPHLRELFGCEVGLSDHTMGVGVAVASVALGAAVIEKHFTLSRAEGGVDSAFSLEPQELAALVQETERAWQALGGVRYGPTEAEQKSLVFRRSIYVAADIAAGDLFTEDNLRIVRPGHGASPSLYRHVLGRPARQAYRKGTPLNFDQLL